MNDIPIIPKTKIGWVLAKYLDRAEAANRFARLRDQTGAPLSQVYQARAFRARWELNRFLRRLSAVERARERRVGMAVRGMILRWRSDGWALDEWTIGNE